MDPDHSLAVQLKILINLIYREMCRQDGAAPPPGVTGMQSLVIAYLYRHRQQPVYQRDVEQHFSIRRSTAARMLKQMEQKGWIDRQPVARDRRLKRLCLTEKALALHEQMGQRLRRVDRMMDTALAEGEKEQLFDMLERLKRPFLPGGGPAGQT